MSRASLAVLALIAALAAPVQAQDQISLADLTAAAQAGDPAAQVALGLRYQADDGTLQDHAQAAAWFRKAAEAGNPQAQNALGRLHFTGLGVTRDTATALRWLEAAAQSGVPDYLFDLASVLETTPEVADVARAAALYRRAAEAGNVPAAVSLGVLHQNGTGVAQDFAAARRLYEVGVAAGHPRAQNNLGLLYVRGDGVAQNYEQAAALFQAAADQGLRQAMTNLAVLYENGFGVALDESRAATLYRQAGSGAVVDAASGFTYDPRLGPPPRDAQALELLRKSARADDPVALFQLGWLLVAAPQADFAARRQAQDLFRRAAERGHGPAMANLAWMYFEGLGGRQDYVLGHMWMLMAKRAGTPTQALDARHARTATPDQVNTAQSRAGEMLEAAGQDIHP